jgi:hypothetical protein
MAGKVTTLKDSVEDQLAAFSGQALMGEGLTEAARNITGFVELLARIDCELRERGDDNARDGSGHRVRKAQ